ncbi:cyclopropane-fatty-acyl-phospholipid synthase family protein [Microvirga sp. VF16]|uniref:SAM-dependent methyltransferase n=1 Tax=Microvirga sp. VF16 TaxID=2807101 RepID=UPI00193D237D|nr:methyltransferase domain-containing protein [Microvirga sp. VF16]QRM35226.1 methyltransferase domain-containing protein [Microvirga sp. VF16]
MSEFPRAAPSQCLFGQHWLTAFLDVQPGDRILVFGCGSGLELSLCLACGAGRVVGFDSWLVKLAIAYRRNRAAFLLGRLNLRHGGLEALSGGIEPVDKVLCINTVEHVENRIGVLRKLSTVVTAGGRIVIATDARASLRGTTALGEDTRLDMIGTGWTGTRVETLPRRRDSLVCTIGHRRR